MPQSPGQTSERRNGPMSPEMRWVIGVVVGLTATVGLMILAAVVSFALEPPEWLQIVVGILLVGVGCLLSWLVASALGQRDRTRVADEIELRGTSGSPSRESSSR
jgi:protein-S-isoprenylcysteine O-methyltransferase Ste14